MISPVKAIIFDADGVLLDSLSIWRELGKRYITDLGYHPIAGMEEILFPMSMEQGAAWLKSRFALGFSEEKIVEDLKVRIQNYYFEEVPAKSGARELFQYLASQKIPAVGETIEIMKPDGRNIPVTVEAIYNEEGESMESAPHAQQRIYVKLNETPEVFDILRRGE